MISPISGHCYKSNCWNQSWNTSEKGRVLLKFEVWIWSSFWWIIWCSKWWNYNFWKLKNRERFASEVVTAQKEYFCPFYTIYVAILSSHCFSFSNFWIFSEYCNWVVFYTEELPFTQSKSSSQILESTIKITFPKFFNNWHSFICLVGFLYEPGLRHSIFLGN